MIKNELKYFQNKICTIFTGPINRSLPESALINYFIGEIVELGVYGVTIRHLSTNCKSFYFYQKIIGIAEEKTVEQSVETKKTDNLYDSIEELMSKKTN